MKKILFASVLLASSVFGHTALMSCFDNGDNTITCEGGFSDGSTAKGVKFKVLQNDKIIVEGKMNEDSEYTFDKPKGDFEALFDAGPGHQVTVKSGDISE